MANNPAYSSILSTRAQKEFLSSYDWYEERQIGLGDRFEKEVLNTFHRIEQNPESFSIRYKLYREAAMDIFPVIVIYKLNNRKKSIRIVSVFHTARNFKYKY